jgi:hypothetical protein
VIKREYLKTVENLGCYHCKFVDRVAIGRGQACCTYPGKIQLTKNGKCKSKRK